MRSLLVLASVFALCAQAQPSPSDSANVEQVLDAAMLETTLISFEQSAGAAGQALSIESYVTVDALRDSVRGRFYADLQPDLLDDAVAFFETPAYRNSVALMQANQADPNRVQAVLQQIEAGTGERADSSLVARYLEATLAYETMTETQTQMVSTLMDSIPPMREAYTAMATANGITVDSLLSSMSASMRDGLMEGARIALAETPEEDIEAAIDFYETPAGPYFHHTVSEGVQRALIPAMVRMMRDMVGERDDPQEKQEDRIADTPRERIGGMEDVHETVDTPPQLIGGMQALSRAVAYPEDARAEGVEGKVFVQFVVSTSGTVLAPTCLQDPDPRLCDAALRAVAQQRFSPGIQDRQPVKVLYTVPVNFVLR
ncbi:MAG: hypothetical protein Rubg2KO_05920 [Rubricoccaceae bacterium]